MNWNLFQAQLNRSLVPRVPADDHVIGIDYNRLTETKLANRSSNGLDSSIIDARIVVVGIDVVNRRKRNL